MKTLKVTLVEDLARQGVPTTEPSIASTFKRDMEESHPYTPYYRLKTVMVRICEPHKAYMIAGAVALVMEFAIVGLVAELSGDLTARGRWIIAASALLCTAIMVLGVAIYAAFEWIDGSQTILHPPFWQESHYLGTHVAPAHLKHVCAQALKVEDTVLVREYLCQRAVPINLRVYSPASLVGSCEVWRVERGVEHTYLATYDRRMGLGIVVPLVLVG